ncbi:ribonuclease HII [Neochlamydia sp. AcF95]|uniref:ribonuclease HII n=1 Tax=Neochlamydia sp. AcF95 TaxID=2795734 RepID=UPI001BC9B755|nr:ribonuclease HII [Neochlamydia sp. AcF95]MBS4170865.1 Ribonuclease HII [Neochlamydia sp. AcF95]
MSELKKIGKRETKRLLSLTVFEEEARQQGYQVIAGIDEAGRGPLAGPVVAAACIIPVGLLIPEVNDSKQLSSDKRTELYNILTRHDAIHYGIGVIDSPTIDKINIYQATIAAMLKAVAQLSLEPHFLLVDGLKLPHPSIPTQKIIKGDTKSQSIAAASIIAKVTRDRLMIEYHQKWPLYGFDQHKGYGTAKHLEALNLHGVCPIHRQSFGPVRDQLGIKNAQFSLTF